MDNKNHTIMIENRVRATLSGIEKVLNSSDTVLNLVTNDGGLTLAGKEFKIEKFNIDDGSLVLSGTIDSIKYSAAKAPLFKRIFK